MVQDIVPFIRMEGSRYVVDEETLEWISSMKTPLSVMMCAGKFRTGKSFLLNRFAECTAGKGFGVGGTVQACTRGIWVCKTPLQGKDGQPILIMDTEGIDALDVESSHDVRIFALSVLLGSVFCYNSMSHIDEAAVQTLSLMTRVAESLSTSSHHPVLYWVLRDFALQMVDEHGNPMSHEQYLEKALTPPVSSKDATREALKRVFTNGNRFLVTLPRPHKDETTRLDRLDKRGGEGNSGVNPKFDSYLKVFRTHVSNHAPLMSAGGVTMTGPVYAGHVRNIVKLINESDSVPPLEDAWSLLTKSQHSEEVRRVKDVVFKNARETCPVTTEDGVTEFVRNLCLDEFRRAKFMPPPPDTESHIEEFTTELVGIMKDMHRVVDLEGLAREHVSKTIQPLLTAPVHEWDMLAVSESELEWSHRHGNQGSIASKLLEGVVKDAWPRVREELLNARSENADYASKVDVLVQELEDVRTQEKKHEEQVQAMLHRSREDASTMTDEYARESIDASIDVCTGTCAVTPGDDGAESGSSSPRAVEQEMKQELEALRVTCDERTQEIERLKRQCASYISGMEVLRDDARTEVDRWKRESCTAKEAEAMASKRAELSESQKLVLAGEVDKLQSLLKEGQNKTVDLHRLTLEEARKRDQETREYAERTRKAQSEMFARAEGSEREVRMLKRRVEELLETDKESKRLKSAVHDQEIQMTRLQSHTDSLRAQLETTRGERDTLRASNVELQNRVAVLEASQTLDSYRRSMTRD